MTKGNGTKGLLTWQLGRYLAKYMYIFMCINAHMGLSAWKHRHTHISQEWDGVLEHFKDTGSAKKDRKWLWMAVPNKIDRALKIYKSPSFFSQIICHPSLQMSFQLEMAIVKGCKLPCCAHICRGCLVSPWLGSWPAWLWRCSDRPVW